MLEEFATGIDWKVYGPPTIMALATIVAAIVAAWIRARSDKQGTNQSEGAGIKDKIVAVASIVAAGFAVTAVVMLYGLVSGQISARAQLSDIEESARRTLADFRESPADIGQDLEDLDEDAKAILDGAGPKEWKSGERTWRVGDVVYADQPEWVAEVFPQDKREELTIPDQWSHLQNSASLASERLS